MMLAWLIYNAEDAENNSDYIAWMIKEANSLHIDLKLRVKEQLIYGVKNNKLFVSYKGEEDHLPAFIIMRSMDSLLSKQFELLGIKVYNSAIVSDISNDKAKTHQFLARHQIPMVDTLFGNSSILDQEYPMEFPYVIKESSGRGGQQVYIVNSKDDVQAVKNMIGRSNIIVQSMATPGRDVRVFVVGKEIIAAILRESNDDFRANHSLGGCSGVYHLSSEDKELVDKIISLFQFGMVGIDFVFDSEGKFLFNEIEDVVGSRTLSKNTDINIVKIYLEYILNDMGR